MLIFLEGIVMINTSELCEFHVSNSFKNFVYQNSNKITCLDDGIRKLIVNRFSSFIVQSFLVEAKDDFQRRWEKPEAVSLFVNLMIKVVSFHRIAKELILMKFFAFSPY